MERNFIHFCWWCAKLISTLFCVVSDFLLCIIILIVVFQDCDGFSLCLCMKREELKELYGYFNLKVLLLVIT